MTEASAGTETAGLALPPGGPWVALPSAPNVMLRDLGPSMNTQFFALYDRHLGNAPFDEEAFRAAAFDYMDAEFAAGRSPDPFFDNLGFIGLPRPETPLYWTGVWEWALAIVHDWEAAAPGRRVHKGTGYYFAGVRDIALGDLDRGFLYMHRAVNEDALSSGSTLPGTQPSGSSR